MTTMNHSRGLILSVLVSLTAGLTLATGSFAQPRPTPRRGPPACVKTAPIGPMRPSAAPATVTRVSRPGTAQPTPERRQPPRRQPRRQRPPRPRPPRHQPRWQSLHLRPRWQPRRRPRSPAPPTRRQRPQPRAAAQAWCGSTRTARSTTARRTAGTARPRTANTCRKPMRKQPATGPITARPAVSPAPLAG